MPVPKKGYFDMIIATWITLFFGVMTDLTGQDTRVRTDADSPIAHTRPTFAAEMLDKSPITHPEDPFILIFNLGGRDDALYGFRTDGEMSIQDWKDVFSHVGHLTAYSIYTPSYVINTSIECGWTIWHRGRPLEAAQAIGRQSGGCIMGVPEDEAAIQRVRDTYVNPLGLRITHFNHDDEIGGHPAGGCGDLRLSVENMDYHSALKTAASSDFNAGVGQSMESFRLDFGVSVGNLIYGGDAWAMGEYRDSAEGSGWAVRLHGVYNTGETFVRFYTDGNNYVESLPIPREQGLLWNHVRIEVDGSAQGEQVRVSITIQGVGRAKGLVARPGHIAGQDDYRLHVGMRSWAEQRVIHYDDIKLTGILGGAETLLAHYRFEGDGHTKCGDIVETASDWSGRGHALRAYGGGTFAYRRTTGIDQGVMNQLGKYLVADVLNSRNAHNKPHPETITNWRISDRPGWFAAYSTEAGFTHGNAVYYHYGDWPEGQAISRILQNTRATQWAWADGSFWNHAWLGAVRIPDKPDGVSLFPPTPRKYQSLISLAVLDGNRWFWVYCAMSDGHLAPSSVTCRTEQARYNAGSLYAMAQAASWFQSTSQTLKESVFLEKLPVKEASGLGPTIVRARRNKATGELWFAGLVPQVEGNPAIVHTTVLLPSNRGVIKNLATGDSWLVTNGTWSTVFCENAEPYYFLPNPE